MEAITIVKYNVRIFFDHDALSLVLDMPAGPQKEEIAKPASVLDPCEKLIKVANNEATYYFLFIIPETRDGRMLVAATKLEDLYGYAIHELSKVFDQKYKLKLHNLFTDFKD